jgi:hypothetical protein
MKARIKERVEAAIGRQRRGKHVFAATNQHMTIEELLEVTFLMRSVPKLSYEDLLCVDGLEDLDNSSASHGMRREGNPVNGGITEPPCSLGHK